MTSIRKPMPFVSRASIDRSAAESLKTTSSSATVTAATTGWAPAATTGAPVANERKRDRAFDGQVRAFNVWQSAKDFDFNSLATGITPTLYVNGMGTNAVNFDAELSIINWGNQQRSPTSQMIGVYNATQGYAVDVAQSIANKAGVFRDKSVNGMRELIHKALEQTTGPVRVIGYSAGGVVLHRALKQLKNDLTDKAQAAHQAAGLSRKKAKQLAEAETLTQLERLDVITFGSASRRFVEGPQYTHFAAKGDKVPTIFGPTERTVKRHSGETLIRFDPADARFSGAGDTRFPHSISNYAAALVLHDRGQL